jgi:hypothetical protein
MFQLCEERRPLDAAELGAGVYAPSRALKSEICVCVCVVS